MINILISYSLIVLYNFKKIKYELGQSSFKFFNNIVGKYKYYYTTKKVLYVGHNIYKIDFKFQTLININIYIYIYMYIKVETLYVRA